MASENETEPAEGSSGNGSPVTTKNKIPKVKFGITKLKKGNKICAFFQRTCKGVKKAFPNKRVEPLVFSTLPDHETSCVPGPSTPKPEPKVDLVDLSAPEPDSPVTTKGSESQTNYLPVIFQLERRLHKSGVPWTPINEVWPNLFIGNEETALNQDNLKEIGITHILNAAEYEDDLHEKINPRAEYYQSINITYYSVLVTDDRFHISKDLFPASEFIHKALRYPENKVLLHCMHGVTRSATVFLAYLMIHQDIRLEDAIDHVKTKRWVRPDRDHLIQLITLDSNLHENRS